MSKSLLEGIENAGQSQAKTGTEVLPAKLPSQVASGGSQPAGLQPKQPAQPEVKPTMLRTDVNPTQGASQVGGQEKVKRVLMDKLGSGPWTFKFEGDVKNRDINMLRIKLVHAFRKFKLKSRVARLKLQRKVENDGN